MKHLFQITFEDEGGDETDFREFSCLAKTPHQAFLIGLMDLDEFDWITLENRQAMIITEFLTDTTIQWEYLPHGWFSRPPAPLPTEVPEIDLESIERWMNDIDMGAGWTTDNYVINFCDDLTDLEKFVLMAQLISQEMLYDEAEIGDHYDETVPEDGCMGTDELIENYLYLKTGKKDGDTKTE